MIIIRIITLKVIVAFAFGAYAVLFAMKLLEVMKKMQHTCSFIGEKCNYIEKRMDAAGGKISDLCRHMQQMFEEFDEGLNEGPDVESKWWWVQRRIRSIYEDFCRNRTMQTVGFSSLKSTWSLLQMEVKLRVCRDIMALRYYAVPGEPMDEEWSSLEHCLKNILKASKYCEFWRPMSFKDFEEYTATTGLEEVLISQVKERIAELNQYVKNNQKGVSFEDLGLEDMIGAASQSSS